MTKINEQVILNIAVDNIRKISQFDPYRSYDGVNNKEDFRHLLNNDPAFSTLGLINDKYITARVGGNLVTSLHRKIGDMYENIFSYLLKVVFGINQEDMHFSVNVIINGRTQERSTDGLITKDKYLETFPDKWRTFNGVGFELRSCYQIGDSKRIQADYDMSLALKEQSINPVMFIFCNTSLKSPIARLSKSWELYQGHETFRMINLVTGFNLYNFLEKNKDTLSFEMEKILVNF